MPRSIEQRVREGLGWEDIEKEKARKRQIELAGTRPNRNPDLMPNLAQGQKGTTREKVAARVGLKRTTYHKGTQVVKHIDEEIRSGNKHVVAVLRRVLEQESVDAALRLIKKPTHERSSIISKIVSGEAKDTKAASRLVAASSLQKDTPTVESDRVSASTLPSLAGFSTGDRVRVNDRASRHGSCVGLEGQVEQIWVREQLISVNLENGMSKVRFLPHELTLVKKAPPSCPYRVEEIVFVNVDRGLAATLAEKKWHGFWGKIRGIGEMGSIRVDVGREVLQLFPRDLKPIDAPGADLFSVAERVLRLRRKELDEIEEKMLNVLQRRTWFTRPQLIYLDAMEKIHGPEVNLTADHAQQELVASLAIN